MQDEKQYIETKFQKWLFRICSLVLILITVCWVIRWEFRQLANNKDARKSIETIVSELSRSIENLQDAWNTMYYFHQTGDLMKIIKCPMSNKHNTNNNENTLLMLYREDLGTKQMVLGKDLVADFGDVKHVRCGGNVTIEIGLKEDINQRPKNTERYTFKTGEEPIALLERYPFVKYAIGRLRYGERATFIALPAEKKLFIPKKQTIYEMSVPMLPSTEITDLPLHMHINKNDDKFAINDRVVCGSVVHILFKITDIEGKVIMQTLKMEKLKVGSGNFNDDMEQILTQMRTGDRYKIILTKQMFRKTDILNKDLFKENDIVIVDLTVVNVQK